jgi:hypothetical protein
MPNLSIPATGEAVPVANLTRRSLLTGMAAVPLIALPATAIAVSETPQERLQRQFQALCETMDELTADVPGWMFIAYSRRPPFAEWMCGAGFNATGISFDYEDVGPTGRGQKMRVERHVKLGGRFGQ